MVEIEVRQLLAKKEVQAIDILIDDKSVITLSVTSGTCKKPVELQTNKGHLKIFRSLDAAYNSIKRMVSDVDIPISIKSNNKNPLHSYRTAKNIIA